MKLWWLTNSGRLGVEKTAVEQLSTEEDWFKLTRWRINAGRFSADGVITAHGIDYTVRLIYPDQFPLVPAWVEPQEGDARWSEHQYGKGGTLCLELRPDNWVPTASGADVLRSAFHLLRSENPRGDGPHEHVTSAHNVGHVQSYDWGQNPVLIGASCLERIRDGSGADISALRWFASDDVWPIMVFDLVDRAQPQHPPSFDLGTLRYEVPVLVARIDPPSPLPETRAEFASALGLTLDPERHKDAIVVITVGNGRASAFHLPDAGPPYERKWVVLPDHRGLRSGRDPAAVGKRVAIVGLGSVGSKVSEILLRSGIYDLVLVDGDVLLPGNLERHTLDWRDVGYRKVHAVKRRLLQIVPGAKIDVVAKNLNWQRSARAHAAQVDQIAGCDLILDATGDVPTSLLLGAIADENKQPFVSAEVFEGGIGCVIARSLPGRDPSYVLERAAYAEYCDRQKVKPPPSGAHNYEAFTDAGEPMVADDAAVTMTASHTARVALDVLDGRVDSADAAWLLVGFRRGWLFQRHGETLSLDMGPPASSAPVEENAEALAFVISLAKEALGASNATE